MKKINLYIIEKLKINKDSKVEGLDYPVVINLYCDYRDISNVKDEIYRYTPIKNLNVTKLSDKINYNIIGRNTTLYLYSFIINDRDSLLWLLVYALGIVSNTDKFTTDTMNYFKDIISNYKDVKMYLEDFTNDEYQKRINEYISV